MVTAVMLSCALLTAAWPADLQAARSKLADYDSLKSQVGRDADAQVKLALWCEAHGLTAERVKHLALAVLKNPNHATARGLLGFILSQGKWQKPSEIGLHLAADADTQALVREYLQRRAATPERAEAQGKLAQWCEEHGLSDQALAHYSTVVRLDPKREAAWKKLGYRKRGESWVKPEQIAAQKLESDEQKLANRHWRPILEKYREGLLSKDGARRTRVEGALAQISDPRAVPAVWEVFVSGDKRMQTKAVQVLGQIDGPAASKAISAMAVFSPFPEVRGLAIDTASRRDPRDFLDSLLSMIRRPFRYKVQPVNGPGSEGGLFVEGERFNIQRLYQVETVDNSRLPQRIFSPDVPFDPFTSTNMMLVSGWGTGVLNPSPSLSGEGASQLGKAITANPAQAASLLRRAGTTAQGSASASNFGLAVQVAAVQRDQQIAQILGQFQQQVQRAQQSLAEDIQTVEAWNQGIREVNDRVLPLVKSVTGQDFGSDSDAWRKWWNDQLGYAYQSPSSYEKPTYTQLVVYPMPTTPPHSACFAAATPVQTIDGPRPIEELQVGDCVLSQNTATGALSYQPVVQIHHNPPSPTLKLRLSGETIVATGIHRFWKAGKGWTMARDLRPGDVVRQIGGTSKLESVEPGKVERVFNLDVAQNRDFFVGKQGHLVYDFSIVHPVSAPFDRVPDLASGESSSRPSE
jgi:hypothetical protein